MLILPNSDAKEFTSTVVLDEDMSAETVGDLGGEGQVLVSGTDGSLVGVSKVAGAELLEAGS